jgi:hypothetical protein
MVRKQSGEIDSLLEPLLSLIRNDEIDQLLSQLIVTHADPVIKGVIRQKLQFNSNRGIDQACADDIHQEVVAQLLVALQRMRQQPTVYPVNDFRGLTAVIAHRACSHWMRQRFPERHALKNRLAYLLTRHREFALWKGKNNRQIAGFAIWQGQKACVDLDRLSSLSTDEKLAPQIRLLRSSDHVEWGGALTAIFDSLEAPVDFDRLAGALAGFLQAADRPIQSIHELDGRLAIPSGQPDAARQTESRIFLHRLWEEVRQLPRNQRVALLLNLRDQEGRGCLALFPALGVATFRQIAETTEISAERLAELCSGLPLEDAKIAELLQLTPRQVINSRKSARLRLARRLKEFI